ncbi:zonular occludens toxin domain-containing protein [Thauera linaloolentis]|uniref:Zonular occludens toxin n=1 Tax=Thauera linaloolentis (strain DSM 12138 / JCM 21573 / CCUG 41526 / CIP 105981 / IAM 15112 / NBRC 102519 / 47Lol) TaxID=1123367 RepID=N6YW99_THAL4|nr:zonular occludens toxin domain-containing protein [Thauera linaloolentis]ENO86702.1 zonular occludens toxin [Thauera linaloolentis 47Lol = DSM 12138]MCM8566183.1 hypothetical protein [Thauera linaloolentis]
MSDYLVTGKKGNGKSLVCVGRIREALLQGRVVATNLDLYLEHLLPVHHARARVIRLPDFPGREDLDLIGSGNPTSDDGLVDESRNGLLVLDELAVFLNARTFQDKRRSGLLEWLVHSRKLGWDTYLIAQHPNQVDKQIREAMAEYHVICRRMDKIKIPFLPIKMPRVHVGFVRYGMERDSILAERWAFRGNSLFRGYDTRQRFREGYPHGPYSYLPPWHLKGYRIPLPAWRRIASAAMRVPLEPPSAAPVAVVPGKPPLVRLLERLPADQRMKHYRRLQALGAL